MPEDSTFEDCRSLIREAHSVLKSEIPRSEIGALDPMESAIVFGEQKKQWLFAAAQKLSAMTNYQVSLLSEGEQSVRNNLISGSEGLLAIRSEAEINQAATLAQLRGDRETGGSFNKNELPEGSPHPTWANIVAWGFGVCLLTGLARPMRPGSDKSALSGWLAPETRNVLLENPVFELAVYMGVGIGGAIGPAILAYGIYWGIRHLIKPRTKINWSALLGLSIAFGAMSVLGSYSNTTESNINSELHTGGQSTSSIENSLAALAAEMSSQVPIQVDHMTTVTGVAAFGSTLNLYHSFDIYIEPTQIGATRTDLLLQTRERVCQKPEMAALIEAGISIYYRYSDLGGNLIDFTIRECS